MARKACLVDSVVSLYFHFNPDYRWHSNHHLLSVFKLLPSTVFFFPGWISFSVIDSILYYRLSNMLYVLY